MNGLTGIVKNKEINKKQKQNIQPAGASREVQTRPVAAINK